jgi:osmoprotectant transport system ATP-binding protein
MIYLQQVNFQHGANQVLTNINLHIRKYQRTVLLGRSGSGKSTLLRLLNRLAEPASGQITFEGQALGSIEPQLLRRNIGFVSQGLGLFPHWTARQQIARFHQQGQSIEALAASLGLETKLLGRYPHQLSGGQQQRVAIARALASDPSLLLLDEPFSALDPILRNELQELILGLSKTIVFVTHDIREGLRLGQQLVFLREGRIVFDGPQDALASCTDEEVQAYLRTLQR